MTKQQAADRIATYLANEQGYKYAFNPLVILAIVSIIVNIIKILIMCNLITRRRMYVKLQKINLFNKRKLHEAMVVGFLKIPQEYIGNTTIQDFEKAFLKFNKELTFEEFCGIMDDYDKENMN